MKFNGKSKYDIIIPVFNSEKHIEQCVKSVVMQTYKYWRVVVIDNCSTDNTLVIIRKLVDPKKLLILSYSNKGVIAGSRNKGIMSSSSDWVCFLDSDDFWYPNKLDMIDSYTKKYEMISHSMCIIDKDSKIIRKRTSRFMDIFFYNSYLWLMVRNVHVTSSVTIKRSLLFEMECFDTRQEFIAAEDYDLWLKIVKHNNVKHLFNVCGSYRSHEGGVSKKIAEHILAINNVLNKNLYDMNILKRILFYPFVMSSYYSMVAYRRFIYNGISQYSVIITSSLKSIVLNPIQIKSYYCIYMSTVDKARSILDRK
jgi:glycosyltransferase involved in cell wall biosynthesis